MASGLMDPHFWGMAMQEASKAGKKWLYLAPGLALMAALYWVLQFRYEYVREHYLLIHAIAELFSIVVACGIFVVVWNSRRFWDNSFFLVLGIGYLFSGAMDLVHTLAYSGMGVFTEGGTNLPTQLWVSARYVQAGTLLIAPLLLGRRISARILLIGYGLVFACLLVAIFGWRVFPTCFIEGSGGGLTHFKVISEWAICAVLVLSAVLLLVKRRHFDRTVLTLTLCSIAVSIASELAFTLYRQATGPANLVGHLLKIAAFYLIYRAVIETALKRPYSLLFRELRSREDSLRTAVAESRRRREENAALLAASRAVLEHHDFQSAAKEIFDSAKSLIGAAAGYVALLDATGQNNEVVFLDSGGMDCSVDTSLPMPVRGLREIAYRSGKGVYDNNFAEGPYARLMPDGHVRLENVLFAPLSLDGDPVGLLGLANKPGGFTERDVELADRFSEFAAIALRNSRSQESLEYSERRFRVLAETASDAIVCSDRDGNVVLWNDSAEAMFGYSPEEMIGKSVTTIIPERFRDIYTGAMASAAEIEQSRASDRTVELTALRRSGQEFPVELSLAGWRTGEGVFFTSILRDITRRKEAEEALRSARDNLELMVAERTADLKTTVEELQGEARDRIRAERTLQISHDFLEIGFRHKQVKPLLDEFIEQVRAVSGCAAAGVRLSDDRGNMPYKSYQGFPKTFCESASAVALGTDHRMCTRAMESGLDRDSGYCTKGGSFFVGSATDFLSAAGDGAKAELRDVCKVSGFESVALMPIRYGDEVLGLVHVADPGRDKLSLEKVEILERVTAHLGTALCRIMAEEQVDRERKRLFSVLQMLPGYVVLIAPDKTIRFANDTFGEIFGDFSDKHCYEVIQGRHRPCDPCVMDHVIGEPTPQDWEWTSPEGRCFHVWGYPFEDVDGSKLILELGTDITERKRLETEIVRIIETEKRHIGSDLHDSLGQTLGGISCLSQVLHQKLSAKQLAEAEDAAKIEMLVSNSVGLTRSLARGLNPVGLQPGGLMVAIRELAANVESVFGVKCKFNCAEPVLLSDDIAAVHLYRIAQEATNNAVRHGKAKKITIELSSDNGAVTMSVEDNGVGLPEDPYGKEGLGLRIMKYRAGTIGASISVSGRPNGGTAVVCKQARPWGSGNANT